MYISQSVKMKKYRILLVEDDLNLGQILKEYLEVKGFEVRLCEDGLSGIRVFRQEYFDLCILDIMLPKMDGFALAGEIRTIKPEIPFIFLTAKSMKEDTISGLKLGADDYITKPFSMEELLLRLKAIIKRVYTDSNEPGQVCKFGLFEFHYDTRILKGASIEDPVKLTTKEAELLKLLCNNLNREVDRSHALKAIWKDDSYFNARSMDVYIAKLRKYLKEDPNIAIQTIHGQGFKLLDKSS